LGVCRESFLTSIRLRVINTAGGEKTVGKGDQNDHQRMEGSITEINRRSWV